MKNKAILPLAEITVMLLVFALAAAITLGAFSKSSRISEENRDRDNSVLLARSVAEVLKSTRGDLKLTGEILTRGTEDDGTAKSDTASRPIFTAGDDSLVLYYGENTSPTVPERAEYTVFVRVAKLDGYSEAEITVEKSGRAIFTLPAAWSDTDCSPLAELGKADARSVKGGELE